MKTIKHVTICEVGPRDGLQNEKKKLSVGEKADIIDRISDAGFKVIEVGAFMHPKAVPTLADTDEVFKKIHKKEGVEYRVLIGNSKGVDRAANCGCKKVKLNVSACEAHNLANLNRKPLETAEGFKECADKARDCGIEISGSISMPFGSAWVESIPEDFVRQLVECYLDAGITEISLSDTNGVATPVKIYNMCSTFQKEYPQVAWRLHLHNSKGMGMANVMAGMEAGITWFDSAYAGVGGCLFVPGASGLVSTEDLVNMCEEMGIETGIDLDKVVEIGHRIEALTDHRGESYVLRSGTSKTLLKVIPTGQKK